MLSPWFPLKSQVVSLSTKSKPSAQVYRDLSLFVFTARKPDHKTGLEESIGKIGPGWDRGMLMSSVQPSAHQLGEHVSNWGGHVELGGCEAFFQDQTSKACRVVQGLPSKYGSSAW